MIAALITLSVATLGQVPTVTFDSSVSAGVSMPGRVASAGGGITYVTDQKAGTVLEISGGVVAASYPIPEGPVGIGVHPVSGDIYVSRLDGMVGIYDAAFVETGTFDPAPLTLTTPNDIAVHPATGEVYVVDSGAHQIVVFDGTTGLLARAFGGEGSGLGELRSPQAVAIDAALDHVIVADTDNFRIQVFNTAGVFQYKFGYRTLFIGSTETAWIARPEGVAIDTCGNIYVSDALMGTVRAFDYAGQELDPTFAPVLTYATDVKIPIDVSIDGASLVVASNGASEVGFYTVTCSAVASADADSRTRLDSTRGKRTRRPVGTDNPAEIVAAQDAGTYAYDLDLNRDRTVDMTDLEISVAAFGAGSVDGFVAEIYPAELQPPHMIADSDVVCGRCHSMDGLPGGMLSAAGQENLCLSCHTASAIALNMPIETNDKEMSHPWGMSATAGGVMGPDVDSELALHLDGGNVRCGTCHDPHERSEELPYLRTAMKDVKLCSECHAEYDQWTHAGHSDEHADPFSHYDWALPNRADCRKCHSGNGYIDFSDGLASADQDGSFRVHDCLVCHATHGKSQDDELLRIYDDVVIPAVGGDVLVTGQGASATCMTCHNGRRAPDSGSLTPHYMLGGAMILGINANTFGHTLSNSAHAGYATCTACHMADGPAAGNPGAGKVGGHTFNVSVHDPADPDYGYQNLAGCNAIGCHIASPLTTTNRIAWGDYDGDGTTEGVQDETEGLLTLVLDSLSAQGVVQLGGYPYWTMPAGLQDVCIGGIDDGVACSVDADCDDLVLDDAAGDCGRGPEEVLLREAIWNWEFVDNSHDLGVKNTAYAVGALQATYFELEGVEVPGATLRYVNVP